MKYRALILIIIFYFFTSCGKKTEINGIVLIDGNKSYPILDIKLSDIADIKFIPLKIGKDSILLNSPATNRGNLFVTKDKIFIVDTNNGDPSLIAYNHQGDPLYKIGNQGRGPGELFGSISFAVDTIYNEIFIWGKVANKMCVYDLEGNFKREKNFDNTITFMSFGIINQDLLFGFNEIAQAYNPDFITKSDKKAPLIANFGRTLIFFDKKKLTYNTNIKDVNFSRIHSKNPFTGSNSLTSTKDGFYFFSGRSDTTYFINSSLKITPKFVDITNYGEARQGEIGIYPVLETDKYILLTTYLSIRNESFKETLKYFAFDKKEQKIYKICETGRAGKKFMLLDNELAIIHNRKCQNHNYLQLPLNFEFLKENYNKLPKTLKRIANQMTENDNPVLMLIKLK